MTESYEEACTRTGRKWPYRTEDWPCPACGKAECDLNIEFTEKPRIINGSWTFRYRHLEGKLRD